MLGKLSLRQPGVESALPKRISDASLHHAHMIAPRYRSSSALRAQGLTMYR